MSWYGFVWKQGFPKFCWWIIILPLELLSGGYHFQTHPHDWMMRFCLAAVHLQLQVWPKHWPGGKRLGHLLGPVATEADRKRTYNIPSLRTGNFAAGIVSICQYSSLPGDQSCFPCDDKLHATRSLSPSLWQLQIPVQRPCTSLATAMSEEGCLDLIFWCVHDMGGSYVGDPKVTMSFLILNWSSDLVFLGPPWLRKPPHVPSWNLLNPSSLRHPR